MTPPVTRLLHLVHRRPCGRLRARRTLEHALAYLGEQWFSEASFRERGRAMPWQQEAVEILTRAERELWG